MAFTTLLKAADRVVRAMHEKWSGMQKKGKEKNLSICLIRQSLTISGTFSMFKTSV